MKVASYLINHHLDWDCPALIKSKEQSPTTSAAKATEKLVKSSEEALCCSQARVHNSLFVLDTEEKLHCSPVQDSVTSLHNRLHFETTWTELGVYCNGDKLDAGVEEGLNISYLETNPHGLWKVPSIGEGDHLDRHDKKSADALQQCVEIHNGLLKRTDEFNSHAHSSFVERKRSPKGHYVFENFISEKEEQDILLFLDTDLRNPWKSTTFNGLQTGKAYGLSVDLRKRCVRPAIFEMPKVLMPIIERMRTVVSVLKDFWPNETNAIDYRKHKGHWLKAHVDDRQLSGTIVVNLSLCGDCKMTYERERGPRESYKVLLRRRCIQVLTGESRYNFTHSIRNDDLLDPRRVSMTFRQSVDA
ncbi:hypothetical protein GOP47_0000665 [Adiantum capillus-veneris]|uniref:Alpha-ketoglutarate-dependent dioxygenase AlkB-like domain-containing protein n=1 Tax=Adiantum capillus-veneris TaxID=13818 RepID=A0A9D4VDE6_ADICA|nr:hypothetical protein GOP47_0000665 [Adiantum capillus-veneris]